MADANLKIDTTLLDGLIVGRVEPHIYAFSTETVPNYLKVGDTARGVRVRLNEWRKIFPNLVQQYEHSAQIDDETIFRWVLSIPFFISCIRQQNPLTVLSKIILRKVKQFNLPPPKKK